MQRKAEGKQARHHIAMLTFSAHTVGMTSSAGATKERAPSHERAPPTYTSSCAFLNVRHSASSSGSAGAAAPGALAPAGALLSTVAVALHRSVGLERAAGAEEGKVNVLVDEGEVMGTERDSVVGAVVGAGAVWAAALLLPTAALRQGTRL
jgi:hypothetical protein